MNKLTFSKELRLLTPVHFNAVFQQPKRVSSTQMTILGVFNSLQYPRIGLAVAKKSVKLAHERNRIKRLIRESFRLRQYELPMMDFVVIAKIGITELDNSKLKRLLNKLWNHHCRLAYVS